MWPNPQFPADLVIFTEENLNGKLHILCSVIFLHFPEEADELSRRLQTPKKKVTKKVRNKSYYHLERNVRQKLKMFLYMLPKTFFANYFFYIVNHYTEINLLMSAEETFQTDQLNGYMTVTNYQTVISMQYWKHELALIISTANSISLLWHRIPKYFAKTSLSRKQGQLWTFLGF